MAVQLYQMVLSYNSSGQFCQNVLHWRFDDAGFANTWQAAQDLIGTWSNANINVLRDIWSDETTALSIKGRRVTGGGGFEAIENYAPPVAGQWAASSQVSGLATVIVFYPLDESRSRSKMFIPGVPIDALVNGKWTAAFKAAVTATLNFGVFADFSLTGGGTPNAEHVIPGTTAANSKSISEIRLSQTPGTMRRRQRPV